MMTGSVGMITAARLGMHTTDIAGIMTAIVGMVTVARLNNMTAIFGVMSF